MYGIYPTPPPHYLDRHSLFIPANHFFTILLKITALTQKDAMAEKKKNTLWFLDYVSLQIVQEFSRHSLCDLSY